MVGEGRRPARFVLMFCIRARCLVKPEPGPAAASPPYSTDTTKGPAGSVWNPSTATTGRWSDRWTHPMRTTSLRGYTDLMRYVLGIGRNQTKYGAYSTKMVQKYITKKAASIFLPKAMLMYVSQPAEVCVLSGPRELFYRASPCLSLLKESSPELPKRCAYVLKRNLNINAERSVHY